MLVLAVRSPPYILYTSSGDMAQRCTVEIEDGDAAAGKEEEEEEELRPPAPKQMPERE
ncbi:hypothetical protein ACP70R_030882 [Stipagrostis hirtigluma subsp. patula]